MINNNKIPKPSKFLSPLKSIKFYCKNLCCAGELDQWKNCSFENCTLHRYRKGRGNKKSNQKPISIVSNFIKLEESKEDETKKNTQKTDNI